MTQILDPCVDST